MIWDCKILSVKSILMDFAIVTGQVLNSYDYSIISLSLQVDACSHFKESLRIFRTQDS